MSKIRKRKSPQELADLILEHNPGASMEMIADVISEWGGLLDDDLYEQRRGIDMEWAAPAGQHPSPGRSSTSRSPDSPFTK